MHLILPYASSQSEGCVAARPGLKLPHLAQLLARLQAQPANVGDVMSLTPPHERALAKALGLPVADGRIPWAALQAQQDPSLTTFGGAWGYVTLCHWQVNTNHMVMSHLPLPGLTAQQSDALLTAMQPYFEEDGIALYPDQPGRYLARAPVLANIDTASLDRVLGHNLEHWMPSATQAGALLRLQNEMQMLFYTHPVNDQRAAQGLPPVNSFWLSGTGALPAGYQEPSADAEPVVVNELRAAALAENWAAWSQAWEQLDATLIQSLLEHAQSDKPVQITLCGERTCQSWQQQKRSLWQKITTHFAAKPLSELLGTL